MGTAMTTMFSARGKSGLLVSATIFPHVVRPFGAFNVPGGSSSLSPSAALRGVATPPGTPSLAREGDGHSEQPGQSHAEAEEVVEDPLPRARAGPIRGRDVP